MYNQNKKYIGTRPNWVGYRGLSLADI